MALHKPYKQFAVLGLGRFGQSIARTLSANGCDVLCCDNDPEMVREVSKYATNVVQADITDMEALQSLGIGNFDVVVIAIGEHMEASILATLIVKELGVKLVIAKAKNLLQKKILEKVGADKVVLPEKDMGEKIAINLITTNVVDFINISNEFSIVEIEPLKDWVGTTLQTSNIRAATGLNIVAIRRGLNIIVSPKASDVILEGDILVVIGNMADINRYIKD